MSEIITPGRAKSDEIARVLLQAQLSSYCIFWFVTFLTVKHIQGIRQILIRRFNYNSECLTRTEIVSKNRVTVRHCKKNRVVNFRSFFLFNTPAGDFPLGHGWNLVLYVNKNPLINSSFPRLLPFWARLVSVFLLIVRLSQSTVNDREETWYVHLHASSSST